MTIRGRVSTPLITGAIAVAAVLLTSSLTGCFVTDVVKSELSTYAEPTHGQLAHIRLIGSRNVKVYPNSECVSHTVPGNGYPAGPQMGGQRKRDRGMPKPASIPRHCVEIAAVADEPITASFAFYTESYLPGAASTGMPGTRRSASCSAAASFVPRVGRNYEMTATWLSGSRCTVQVFEIGQEAVGAYARTPVPSPSAEGCPAVRAAPSS